MNESVHPITEVTREELAGRPGRVTVACDWSGARARGAWHVNRIAIAWSPMS
jgi:hypothetical protein